MDHVLDSSNGAKLSDTKAGEKSLFQATIIEDPVTGFLAIDLGPDAPILTSEQVKKILADFP
jgi:hypothetical protein